MGQPKYECIKVLYVKPLPEGKQIEIRLAVWNEGEARLEKRIFDYQHPNAPVGESRMGKCIGLNIDEVKMIVDKYDEILQGMVF